MAKPAIVIVENFMYRGELEEFSNKYHFAGPAPGDDASWLTLAASLVTALQPTMSADVTFIRAYGYTDGDKPSIWSHVFTDQANAPKGTLVTTGRHRAPGDAAATLRWPTAKRNTRGKVVYARKYFHDAWIESDANPDVLYGAQASAMNTFAGKCLDGSISSVFHLCLPDGTACQAGQAYGYITTRTLKRRGKRPPT